MQKSIFLYFYICSLLIDLVKLFVGGFPLEIDELELAKFFASHGDISTIKIVRDKKTRICKGYAFIEMNDRKGAESAVEALDGAEMNGKQLTVKINEEPAPKTSYAPKAFTPQRQTVYQKIARLGTEERKKRPRRIL